MSVEGLCHLLTYAARPVASQEPNWLTRLVVGVSTNGLCNLVGIRRQAIDLEHVSLRVVRAAMHDHIVEPLFAGDVLGHLQGPDVTAQSSRVWPVPDLRSSGGDRVRHHIDWG